MKKRLALTLVVTMLMSLFCCMSTAFAAAPTGELNIVNANGDYSAYKIFDLSTEDELVKYTISEDALWYDDVVAASDLFALVPTATDGVYEVYVKDGVADQDIINWAKELAPSGEATATATASNGVATFELDYGYYYISTTSGSVVIIDNVNSASYTITDKNVTPNWDPEDPDDPDDSNDVGKFVSNDGGQTYSKESTASIGDVQKFKINAFVPSYNEGMKVVTYTITDTIPEGFTLDEESITATITSATDDAYSNTTLAAIAVNGNVITVTYTLPADYPADARISIEYEAEVDSDAAYENVNEADLSWTQEDPNDPNDEPSDPGEENPELPPTETSTTTFVYGFNLSKVDAKTNEALDGAEFELYAADGTTLIPVIADGEGRFVVADAANAEDAEKIVAGDVEIFGLAPGTYYLKETKAPEGYNKLETPVEIVIDSADADANGIIENTTVVGNNEGTLLPSTGGIGTTIFYVVGIVLMVGAVAVLFARKRTNTK